MDTTKPSAIHHFQNKSELGVAVIQRHRETFSVQMPAIKADKEKTAWGALAFYFLPYLDFANTPNKICLSQALAGEVLVFPDEMPAAVKAFMESHQSWLEDVFRLGRRRGAFQFKESPTRLTRTFFSALQDALLVKRATGEINRLKDVQTVIRRLVRP